ncbi:MAG: DUF3784 domain-containing protein [Clostridia bacterium]|nr:DUF3784 domain-containing protein [Clostridia bacterium]
MTLKDINSGPNGMIWAVFAVLVLMSIILLSGRGARLIAGYNTASKKGKNEYDEKKLSRVAGAGLSVMTVSVFIMAMWKEALPSVFICIFQAIAVIDCVVMIVLMNTVCKR